MRGQHDQIERAEFRGAYDLRGGISQLHLPDRVALERRIAREHVESLPHRVVAVLGELCQALLIRPSHGELKVDRGRNVQQR